MYSWLPFLFKNFSEKTAPQTLRCYVVYPDQLTLSKFRDFLTMASAHDFVIAMARTTKKANEIKTIMDESYGDKSLSISQVRRIMAKVRAGEDAKDNRGGSKKTVRTVELIEAVEAMVNSDRRMTVRELALNLDTSTGTIEKVLHQDLGLSKRCARWVPRLLTNEHKAERIRCAELFLKTLRRESYAYLDKVVTTDETWISFTTPETKEQSRQWIRKGSRPPTKALVTRSEKKVMVIPFFDSEGLIYTNYVPKNTTVNANYFIKVLGHFLKALKVRRPHKWNTGWVLHMDNARPHTAKLTSNFIKTKNITLVSHPPYSPDLAPADFWLFPEIKKNLAGNKFDTINEVKTA